MKTNAIQITVGWQHLVFDNLTQAEIGQFAKLMEKARPISKEYCDGKDYIVESDTKTELSFCTSEIITEERYNEIYEISKKKAAENSENE